MWLPSLSTEAMLDAAPPLPDGPLYVAEDRGDALPNPPFTASSEDLDAPAGPRPLPRPASLSVGDKVIEGPALHDLDAIQRLAFETMAESTRNPMMNALVSDAHARLAAGAWRPLTAFPRTYPSRIYRLGDVRGLCWRRFNGRGPWQLHYDRAAVVEELPAHVVFGPHGQAVADVFEAIARLDPERVRGLPVPDGVSRFQIPVELIADPEGEPLGEQARLASSVAMTWTENRGWAVDGKAGNHYYIGCYFSYQLHEPHWLSAMGRAMNAAVVAALGEVTRADTERVRREWQAVIA